LKPATPEFFNTFPKRYARDGNPFGVTSPCRECHKARMRINNKGTYRLHRERQMIRQYEAIDAKAGRETYLPLDWYKENISGKPCFYCETVEDPRGADRIDNAVGQVMSNVLPRCKVCNKVRNNHFSVNEMKRIGAVIMAIRLDRQS
jgi:hypothetical protein